MLLIILGIVLIIAFFFILVNAYRRDQQDSLLGVPLVAGTACIIIGIFCPLAGYEDPKLVDTYTLSQMNFFVEGNESNKDVYLIADINGEQIEYVYYYVKDGLLEQEKRSSNTKVIIENIDIPVVEIYTVDAKPTIFSFCFDTSVKRVVIRIPQDKIKFQFESD